MKNFNYIYEEIYKKCKKPLEEIRRSELKRKLFLLIMMFVIGIFLFIKLKSIFFIQIIILFMIVFSIIIMKTGSDYNSIFKSSVIKTLVNEYNKNLNYNQYSGVAPSEYRNGDFESFDKFKSEDGIRGILQGGYKFNMSDVHTQKKEKDENGNISYTTLFYGLFVEIEFDKYIEGKIKVRKNKIKVFDIEENIKMDSGEFEKIYDVYGTNNIITMQILTADTMQMLMDFKEQNKIVPELTIKGNKLYIRFHTGNMFESNLFIEALDYDTLKKYYDTINFTVEITEKMLKNIKETEI